MSEEKKGFFKRLVSGLTKTRDNIVAGFDSIFSGYSSIDEDFYEELEEILIMGDIGINATSANCLACARAFCPVVPSRTTSVSRYASGYSLSRIR